MEITEISVKNIKGFGDPATTIKLDTPIKSGKVSMLVAPNGWGKSSLTAAFDSLRNGRLIVEKENKYKQDETVESELSLTIDGNKYVANDSQNEIHNQISCKIIHCDIYPKAITQNMGHFHSTQGYIGIRDIEICKIPNKINLDYNVTTEKHNFGNNGKILNNLTASFSDVKFISRFTDDIFARCKKMEGKKIKNSIDKIKDYINKQNGNTAAIKFAIEQTHIFDKLHTNENYVVLKDVFCSDKTKIDSFTDILQILSFVSKNSKTAIKNMPKHYEYIRLKTELDKNIQNINTTWQTIQCKEKEGSLLVQFPNAEI